MKKLLLSLLLLLVTAPIGAFAAEHRIALVVGNANYQTGALPTPANDAGLIAQTLQAAGFDVTGARDLNQESLRQAFRDFLDKASASGADTVAYIYLSGYGLQLEGENYYAPIDARIASDANVPSEALRLSDYLKPLAALHLKANIVVLDLARANPYAKSGSPLPGGAGRRTNAPVACHDHSRLLMMSGSTACRGRERGRLAWGRPLAFEGPIQNPVRPRAQSRRRMGGVVCSLPQVACQAAQHSRQRDRSKVSSLECVVAERTLPHCCPDGTRPALPRDVGDERAPDRTLAFIMRRPSHNG
jgi:hypothetical protein